MQSRSRGNRVPAATVLSHSSHTIATPLNM